MAVGADRCIGDLEKVGAHVTNNKKQKMDGRS